MTRRQADQADAQKALCAQATEACAQVAAEKKAKAERKKADQWIKSLTPAERVEAAVIEYNFTDVKRRK